MRILIAEDEYYARRALCASVRDWDLDAEIEQADNGRTALELLREKPFDVLLLDIKMPQLDGLTLCGMLAEEGIEVYTIITSAYSEFDFARQAMKYGVKEYLLKPIDQDKLNEALESACEVLDQRTEQEAIGQLSRWLEHGDVRPDTVEAGDRCFAVFASGASGPLLTEALKAEGCAAYIFRQEPNLTAALAVVSDAVLPSSAGITEGLAHAKGRFFVSEIFPIDNAGEAVQQAQALYGVRALARKPVTSYSELFGRKEYINITETESCRALNYHLAERRAAEAKAAAKELVESLLDNNSLSPYCVQDALNYICALINRIFAQEALTAGVRLSLEDVDDRNALFKALQDMVDMVCELQGTEQPSHRKKIVDEICQFIDAHYNENLSLKTLASTKLYLNVSYLSRLFKAETGRSFRTYLTDVRLEKAKEQIRLCDLTITQIASRCGYTDVSHFIQLFRDRYGKTPNAYREECIQARSEDVK